MNIYEDELGYAIHAENPTAAGHVQVFPKREVENYNDLTNEEASHLFYIASFAATSVFEGLGAQGTNIILQNGKTAGNIHDKLCINVLPRSMDDGLDFKWVPKKFSEEELKETQEKIKDQTFYIGKDQLDRKPSSKTPMDELKDLNESYLTKQLDRIP